MGMTELVLTHVDGRSDGEALVALVDYDAYTASVKRVKFTGPYKESPELGPLLASGKLRAYREDLRSSNYAWLAHDTERGCLSVDNGGMVGCYSLRQYTLSLTSGRYRSSGEYNPKRLTAGESGSFYQAVSEIMSRRGADILDLGVRDEIADTLGVCIEKDTSDERTLGLTVTACGLRLDKLEVSASHKHVTLAVRGGTLDELYLTDASQITLYSESEGSVGRLYVDDSVSSIQFASEDTSTAELCPKTNNCGLQRLDGYNRSVADLSRFSRLNDFEGCWNTPSNNASVPINVALPGAVDTIFTKCFRNVIIKGLYPYRDDAGNLVLNGMSRVDKSFCGCTGLKSISGYAGTIFRSFISIKFAGHIDVDSNSVVLSFGYHLGETRYETTPERSSLTTNPTGTIRVLFKSVVPSRDGSGDERQSSFSFKTHDFGVSFIPYALATEIDMDSTVPMSKLDLDLGEGTSVTVKHAVHALNVRREVGATLTLDAPVAKLIKGDFPYANIRRYDANCFSGKSFKRTHTLVLSEKLLEIGDRAFYQAGGIDYLVLPRSLELVGTAAFSEFSGNAGKLATICVYRGSYGETWAKGKKLKILGIDSLDDIPHPTSAEGETDFIAAFVETPLWAEKSKPFVAKLLYGETVDITDYLTSVGEMPEPVAQYLDSVCTPTGLTEGEILPEDTVCALRTEATVLDGVFGSRMELLNLELMKNYQWTALRAHDTVAYKGRPIYTIPVGGPEEFRVYVREGRVLYVGCATLWGDMGVSPRKVSPVANLLGPEQEGRLFVDRLGVTVHGERLQGEAGAKARALFYGAGGLLRIAQVVTASSGKNQERTNFFYDVVSRKIYKFTTQNVEALGTYHGEVSEAEFRTVYSSSRTPTRILEDACLTGIVVPKVAETPAPPCFEAEYARTHKRFDLFGERPQVASFIELLSRSGLVKKVPEGEFNRRVCISRRHQLVDGTKVVAGVNSFAVTHLIGFYAKEKFYGFEAGFDPVAFAAKMDGCVSGKTAFTKPERGFFTPVNLEELFCVTPHVSGYNSTDLMLAIDTVSGKLVLAFTENDDTGIVCSFDSAKDARAFYTAYGCKFFSKSSLSKGTRLQDAFIRRFVAGGRPKMDMHPFKGSVRAKNALLAIGHKSPPEGYDDDGILKDSAIMLYCRT
ncbi:hypothetical protein FACS1894208_02140 [Clostridia bacterium]|nr:hypothetical protein FACS1894208_02140 [Clostridia bacterium]